MAVGSRALCTCEIDERVVWHGKWAGDGDGGWRRSHEISGVSTRGAPPGNRHLARFSTASELHSFHPMLMVL